MLRKVRRRKTPQLLRSIIRAAQGARLSRTDDSGKKSDSVQDRAVCTRYYSKSGCTSKDCPHLHISTEEFAKRFAGRRKKRDAKGKKNKNKDKDKDVSGSDSEEEETGKCFEFRDKNSCKWGDRCRFSHVKMVTRNACWNCESDECTGGPISYVEDEDWLYGNVTSEVNAVTAKQTPRAGRANAGKAYLGSSSSRMRATLRRPSWFLKHSPDDLVVIRGLGLGRDGEHTPLEGVKAKIVRVLEGEREETRYSLELIDVVRDKLCVASCEKTGIEHKYLKRYGGRDQADMSSKKGNTVGRTTCHATGTINSQRTRDRLDKGDVRRQTRRERTSCDVHQRPSESGYRLKATIDSGAEDSVNPHKDLFEPGSLRNLANPICLKSYNGAVGAKCTQTGDIVMRMDDGATRRLVDVLYDPSADSLLISTGALRNHVWQIGDREGGIVLMDRGKAVISTPRRKNDRLVTLPDRYFARAGQAKGNERRGGRRGRRNSSSGNGEEAGARTSA